MQPGRLGLQAGRLGLQAGRLGLQAGHLGAAGRTPTRAERVLDRVGLTTFARAILNFIADHLEYIGLGLPAHLHRRP